MGAISTARSQIPTRVDLADPHSPKRRQRSRLLQPGSMPGRSWPSLLPAGTGPVGRVGRPEWAVRADEAVWTGLPFVPAVAGSCHRAGGAQDGDSWACETLTMCRLALYRNVSPRSGAGPPSTSAPVGLGRGPGCSLLATLTPAQGPHWRREAVGPSWERRAGPHGSPWGPCL